MRNFGFVCHNTRRRGKPALECPPIYDLRTTGDAPAAPDGKHGLDPLTHRRKAFTRLPEMTNRQVKDITPAAWAKARRLADLPAAS